VHLDGDDMKRHILAVNNHKKIEDAYEKSEEYIAGHEDLNNRISMNLDAYNSIISLVPETIEKFQSGHIFPYSESHYELESSFELCMQGFYKHSLFALRCVLELGIIGVYFDKDDKAHIEIQGWLRSEDPTPRFRKILTELFNYKNFSEFNLKFNMKEQIENMYSLISNHIHTRGYHFSSRKQCGSNANYFNEDSLINYINLMEKITKAVVILMLLKYPIGMQELPIFDKFGLNFPAGGFLDEFSYIPVMNILDKEAKEALLDISNRDPNAIEMRDAILAMPDLTEEQIKQMMDEDEKLFSSKETRS
jgi:hypothetical protein